MKKTCCILPLTASLLAAGLLLTGCGGSESGVMTNESSNSQMSSGGTDASGTEDGNASNGDADNENTDNSNIGNNTNTETDLDFETPTQTGPDDQSEFEANYRATFKATWSAATHPQNFPADPHFSPLTGAVHSEQSNFWEVGQIASPGIEIMAESGSPVTLLAEIQSVIDEGRALSTITGDGVPESPGEVSVDFLVNRDNPLVSLVSMLAPSPDWFIGINSLPLLDQNGDFVLSMTIDLKLYDSGTDGGMRYDSPDQDTNPKSPIDTVNAFPLDVNFTDGEPFVGQLVIEQI